MLRRVSRGAPGHFPRTSCGLIVATAWATRLLTRGALREPRRKATFLSPGNQRAVCRVEAPPPPVSGQPPLLGSGGPGGIFPMLGCKASFSENQV